MIRIAGLSTLSLALGFWASPCAAQVVLPGAATPTPAGAKPAPAGGKAASGQKKKTGEGAPPETGGSAITKAPGEETIAGQQFQRNGAQGVMSIERNANRLEIGKLVLIGYQISRPAEFCRVEVGEGKISLRPDARYQGLISYQAEIEACPFALDVLDGAVQVRGKVCEFKAADCTVDPAGVWGPPGASIGAEQAKAIEKLRGKADKDARAGFRALLGKYQGNKAKTREIARDQASFSSVREELCRDYAREDKHGFCSSRITLARAVALSASLAEPVAPPPQAEKPGRRGEQRKAAPVVERVQEFLPPPPALQPVQQTAQPAAITLPVQPPQLPASSVFPQLPPANADAPR